MRPVWARMQVLLESIKFSHSIFALPFALIAMLLARRGSWPSLTEALLIVLAMVGARTWAMGVNRLADARWDTLNPRTASRALPSGQVSTRQMAMLSGAGGVLFVAASAGLSWLAFALSFPVLLFLGAYSFTKRLTWACHLWLGICLGLAPLGAWVALRSEWPWPLLELFLAIVAWVAGFDILYALQDIAFDRSAGLHSIPARFGLRASLWLARLLHFGAALLFWRFGVRFELGGAYMVALASAGVLMIAEHWLLRSGDLRRLNLAFFNLNGWMATLLLLGSAVSLSMSCQSIFCR